MSGGRRADEAHIRRRPCLLGHIDPSSKARQTKAREGAEAIGASEALDAGDPLAEGPPRRCILLRLPRRCPFGEMEPGRSFLKAFCLLSKRKSLPSCRLSNMRSREDELAGARPSSARSWHPMPLRAMGFWTPPPSASFTRREIGTRQGPFATSYQRTQGRGPHQNSGPRMASF